MFTAGNPSIYGQSPFIRYLNNALHDLLYTQFPYSFNVVRAIGEICCCIVESGGKYDEDVARKLLSVGLYYEGK